MLATKLNYLQHKLIEMEYSLKENQESIDQKLSHQETLTKGLLWAINQLSQTIGQNFTTLQTQTNFLLKENRELTNQKLYQLSETLGHNLTALQTQSNRMLAQQKACADHALMRKEIQLLAPKEDRAQFSTKSGLNSRNRPIRSCKDEPSKHSGKYLIHPTENDELFVGYCEQTSFGGGWLVIQYRYDGWLDFQRNWTEYQNGFGDVDGEFWLGLERVHRLTSARYHELLVELKDFSGNYTYARYEEFKIGSAEDQYPLTKLGSYQGTAGDSLAYHKSMKFTTLDRDNDSIKGKNCAVAYEGGWWFNDCFYSNLNGPYSKNATAINWNHFTKNGLAYTRMLIRET
uniref:Fibrinogen C-terminal domain-containing protein n=1 Tax=Anopheles christyi TaxID=43041 RepID=A0A182KFP3_9DIPT